MTLQPDSRLHSRTVVVLATAMAVFGGALAALQSRLNAQLAIELGDGIVSSVISFGLGFAIVALAAVFRATRDGLATLRVELAERRVPWWYLTGGVCGAFFVVTQGLSAAVIGVALFTIAVVAGQTVSGMIIDGRGLGTMAPRPITLPRVFAAVLSVGAVALAGSSEFRADVPVALVILPVIAGVAAGWQQAANGQVRVAARSALAATWVNFATGFAAMLVAGLVRVAFVGLPAELPPNLLLYCGGPLAVIFIGAAVVIVRITGVLLLALATIAGQLIGATLLDVFVPVEGHQLSVLTVIGTVITLVAVSIAALSGRQRKAQSAQSDVR